MTPEPAIPPMADLVGSSNPGQGPDSNEMASITARVRLALAEIDSTGTGDTSVGEIAVALLAEIDADPEVAESRRRVWGKVAMARADLKRIDGIRVPNSSAVLDSVATRIMELHAITVDLEAKAQRRLAAAGAYRRLVEARRTQQTVLNAAGFDTFEAFNAASVVDAVADLDAERVRARQTLVNAEHEWEALEAQSASRFPAGERGDALRGRGYRLLGEVADDDTMYRRLVDITRTHTRRRAAETLLAGALTELGFDINGDLRVIAASWLAATATGPRSVT